MTRMILSQWQRKRWLVWNEQESSVISTGAQWYTIGPGKDISVARPEKLHAAWVRMKPFGGPNPVDISLAIIQAKEDYSRIGIKDLKSIPSAVFLDTAFPTARVTFWPVPIAAEYELHVVTKASLPVYTSLVDPLNLPDEYLEGLMWSLCVRMQMAYGLPSRPDHVAAMKQALNVIMMANTQMAELKLPSFLGGRGGDVSSWAGRGLNQAWTVGGQSVLL
jgi:hypothetical protein